MNRPREIKNRVLIEFSALPDNVAVARLAAAAVAGQLPFTLPEIDEIKVAVSEAVTNAIVHGYRDWTGLVRLEIAVRDGEFEVAVEDRGVGMADVRKARERAGSGDPERMGLGFYFMESLMDRLEVHSEPNRGTRVRMVKRPSSQAARRAESS